MPRPDPFSPPPAEEPPLHLPETEEGTPFPDFGVAAQPDLPVPADEPAPTPWHERPWPDPGEPEPVSDAGGTEAPVADEARADLPARTTAIEVATGRVWEAWLDPQAATSVVYGLEEEKTSLWWLGPLTVRVADHRAGVPARVVFGRDALAGRVRILV